MRPWHRRVLLTPPIHCYKNTCKYFPLQELSLVSKAQSKSSPDTVCPYYYGDGHGRLRRNCNFRLLALFSTPSSDHSLGPQCGSFLESEHHPGHRVLHLPGKPIRRALYQAEFFFATGYELYGRWRRGWRDLLLCHDRCRWKFAGKRIFQRERIGDSESIDPCSRT